MDNAGWDRGCFDELAFFGNPPNGSTTSLSFASCHFDPVMFDSSQVTHYQDGSWTDWQDHMRAPAKCIFSTETNSITRINVKVCESSGSGSRDLMYIKLENHHGDECRSEGLRIGDRHQGHFLTFGSGSLGSCKTFRFISFFSLIQWVGELGSF